MSHDLAFDNATPGQSVRPRVMRPSREHSPHVAGQSGGLGVVFIASSICGCRAVRRHLVEADPGQLERAQVGVGRPSTVSRLLIRVAQVSRGCRRRLAPAAARSSAVELGADHLLEFGSPWRRRPRFRSRAARPPWTRRRACRSSSCPSWTLAAGHLPRCWNSLSTGLGSRWNGCQQLGETS